MLVINKDMQKYIQCDHILLYTWVLNTNGG